jgi:formylglycine-generating enzyme required for sulfatase activity
MESAFIWDINPTRGYHPSYAVSNQPYTSPVGSFAANGYGLNDMAGNIFQYCWDSYDGYDTGSPSDPRGASSGPPRVFRGGGWGYAATYCRVADRASIGPSGPRENIGFRVARSSVPTTGQYPPTVITGDVVVGATLDTVTISGEVTNDGGTPVTRRGIVYGLTAAPTLGAAMDAPSTGTSTGAFTSTLTGLSLETTYYARAYATSTVGTGYGADITFKTAPATPVGFSLIAAGVFTMGDALDGITNAPVRQVTVSAFYMAQHETTKALWDEVREWGVSRGYTDLPVGGGKASNHPVQEVNWFDIIKWCNARSEMEGLTPCYTVGGSPLRTGTTIPVVNWIANGYRLPTEAEWEKAARGGLNSKRFPWGDTISHSQANYLSDSGFVYDVSPTRGHHPQYAVGGEPYTSPVGSFAANGYGLYDMTGNVWEWCWDWYGNYDTGSPSDPRGASSGSYRMSRGGSWNRDEIKCRVAYRDSSYPHPSYTFNSIGVRVARSSVP